MCTNLSTPSQTTNDLFKVNGSQTFYFDSNVNYNFIWYMYYHGDVVCLTGSPTYGGMEGSGGTLYSFTPIRREKLFDL